MILERNHHPDRMGFYNRWREPGDSAYQKENGRVADPAGIVRSYAMKELSGYASYALA